jgi:hypothetical protein
MSVESGYVASSNGSSATESGAASTATVGPAAGVEFVRSRPEVLVGAAFAGGMLAAFLLRRFGH